MSQISSAADEFRSRIEDEARFLETCEGGDPGTPDAPSIWVLGIEPGWSLADQAADDVADPQRQEQLKEYGVELQLSWPYNRNAFKLLTALNGGRVEDYVDFARRVRPFEKGAIGYFKANLFPEPFNNVGEWDAEATEATGFKSKRDYQVWMRGARFSVLHAWIEKSRPKLVIGTGLTYLHDFLTVTGTPEAPPEQRFEVNGHPKRLYVATSGTVPVAVTPHLSGGSHGLNSDEATRIAANLILAALKG